MPIDLESLARSSFFRVNSSEYPLSNMKPEGQAASDGPAVFPSISQGEHPEIRAPCFFLHPCETASVLEEILPGSSEVGPLEILQTWFMLVGTVIDLM